MLRSLAVSIASALIACAARAGDAPDYSLTVYSSAQPGALSTANLANYGANLPGYALVRDARRMTLLQGMADLRFSDVAKRIDPNSVPISMGSNYPAPFDAPFELHPPPAA